MKRWKYKEYSIAMIQYNLVSQYASSMGKLYM